MYVANEVMDCCGIQGLVGIPRYKEKFIIELKILEREGGLNVEGDGLVQLNTSSAQMAQEKYLKELGFKPVFSGKNSNSGNTVTVWFTTRKHIRQVLKGEVK